MPNPIVLAHCTWPEVKALLRVNEIVLVPVGAQEQHGPGIGLATDTISADALCRRAATLLGERAAVAPAVPYGVSWHHLRFPGTVALSSRTLATVLVEIATSLARHGFPRVAYVNGHGGNTAAVTLAVEEAGQALPQTRIIGLYGYAFIAEQARALLPAEAIGHAGGDEASVVLAVEPAAARPDAFAAPQLVATQAALIARLRPYNGATSATYDTLTTNGPTGDPRPATAAIGEQILSGAAQQLAAVLTEMLDARC
jgi:creatinine amidohydrolase